MYRIGFGEDIHRLVKGRRLVLGGIVIPSDLGLLGHSDADVVLHSLSDAILGALALGDLGTHFSDADERYHDIDSAIILAEVVGSMRKEGFEIGNVDISIALEKPYLAPFISSMRERIARLLSTAIDEVSIKAMTNERLDAVGRGEACKATSVVLLRRR